jgi:phosphoribosylformimino-5-aminoimidazole carboxamide ribotide isomerase
MIRAIARENAGSEGRGMLQIGGGVRTRNALEGYLALGARRVVLGTAAVKDPDLVRALAAAYPDVVVVAVDAKDGFVATEGWTEVSRLSAADVVLALSGAPIAAVLYTDVARDGMGAGPNIAATAALAERSPFPVIASGGVATTAHLAALAAIANVESAVVGRALYDGSLTVEAAVAAAT